MAVIRFGGGDVSTAEPVTDENNISKPVKRMRWATQRAPGQSGLKKRMSILKRHKRTTSGEEKRHSSGTPDPNEANDVAGPEDQESQQRRIFLNVPVPEDAKDEAGNLKQQFGRNKIRTAKYTPLSFIPKNLYFQFRNIANDYFFFIIVIQVCL